MNYCEGYHCLNKQNWQTNQNPECVVKIDITENFQFYTFFYINDFIKYYITSYWIYFELVFLTFWSILPTDIYSGGRNWQQLDSKLLSSLE